MFFFGRENKSRGTVMECAMFSPSKRELSSLFDIPPESQSGIIQTTATGLLCNVQADNTAAEPKTRGKILTITHTHTWKSQFRDSD